MYCRECGKRVDQWVKFCPYCGAETNFPEEEIKKEEQAKKQSRSEQKDESDSKRKKKKIKISIKKDKSGASSSALHCSERYFLCCPCAWAPFSSRFSILQQQIALVGDVGQQSDLTSALEIGRAHV